MSGKDAPDRPTDDVAGDPNLIVTGGPGAIGRYAVIGHPVAHSRSPDLHEAWFRAAGIPAVYLRVDIPPAELPVRGSSLRFEFSGVNVTIPHKVSILGYVDRIDDSAHAAGAANLLYRDGDKAWTAGNTDGVGFLLAMEEATGEGMLGRDVMVLGAGGAARAIGAAMTPEGAAVTLACRTPNKADSVAVAVGAERVLGLSPELLVDLGRPPDLVVNTLPPAAYPLLEEMILDDLPDRTVICDLNYYNDSPLLKRGRARGLLGVDGRGMFLHQAALSFHTWTGVAPDLRIGRRMLGM